MFSSLIFYIWAGILSIGITFWSMHSVNPGLPILNILMKKEKKVLLWKKIIFFIRFFLLFCLLLLLLPWKKEIIVKEWRNDTSTVIVLDISRSMQADDLSPSRIEKAKEYLLDFTRSFEKIPVGYIIFSGKAFLLSPLSSDIEGIRELIRKTDTESIDQTKKDASGTNIWDAILLALETLRGKKGEKHIVLMTDGRANVGIDPRIVAEEAKKQGIQIDTIAIWSASGSSLSYIDEVGKRQFFYDGSGNTLSADIDKPLLEELSRKTGGTYFSWEKWILIKDALESLGNTLEKRKKEVLVNKEVPITPILVVLCTLLIVIHLWMSLIFGIKSR